MDWETRGCVLNTWDQESASALVIQAPQKVEECSATTSAWHLVVCDDLAVMAVDVLTEVFCSPNHSEFFQLRDPL